MGEQLTEGAEKYGWPEIVFADGTELAFCPHYWDSAAQRHVPANPGLLTSWRLCGGLGLTDVARAEALITRAHAEFNGDHRFRIVKKLLRRWLNDQKQKDWDQVLTGAVRERAYARIEELQDGEYCCDNSRVALRGNTSQMRRYNNAKASGCCGFCDVVEVCPVDGKTYLLGFNYGH